MSPGPGRGESPGRGEGSGPGQGSEGREITIVLADDHRIVRAGLRLLLDGRDGLRVVAEAGDLAELRRCVAAHRPDVVVLDVDMPGGPSLPVIPWVRRRSPRTRIVVLTMYDDPELARTARRLGASDYVLKEAREAGLVEAIRAAAGDLGPAERPSASPPSPGADAPVSARPDGLSPRELEVLELIALGHTNGEIAARLFLSVRTVESHRAHIQRKTGRGPRAELVAYARERGIA